LMLLAPGLARGQAPASPLTLEQAQALALQAHARMQQAGLAVQYQEAMAKTTNALPKLDAQFMVGQYNSAEWRDNNVSLSQSIPFPTVFGNRKALATARVDEAVAARAVTELDVLYQLHETWLELQYLYISRQQLRHQDSIYLALERTAKLRQNAGEGTMLEVVNAGTERSMVQNQIARQNAAIAVQLRQLQWMLDLPALPVYADTLLVLEESPYSLGYGFLERHPKLAMLDKAAEVATRTTALEKSTMLPDISLGYFNQTLIGYQTRNGNEVFFGPNVRFQGFTVGLSIPIWLKPELAKLEASKLITAQATLERQQAGQQLRSLLDQEAITLRQDEATFNWYIESALPNAALTLTQSQRAFDQGEIDYATHLMHLHQANTIQAGHLDAVRAYNLSVLRMCYLLGTFSTIHH
jgi:heavy metal efflux system protein